MKKSVVFWFIVLLSVTGQSEVQDLAGQTGTKLFTYDQVFGSAMGRRGLGSEGITRPLPTIVGWLDAETYLEARDEGTAPRRIFAINASDGVSRIYRDYAEIDKQLPAGTSAQSAAATTHDLTRFVFKRAGDLYLYDTVTSRFRQLTATPATEENPRLSPDGKWVAYTRERNLFGYDLENSIEHQYTDDASDTVYNGWASWVYYEEILGRASQHAAFWWAPDSKRLAFMRFDDSPVPLFPIYHSEGQHGELEQQRYPKAGDPNPLVALGMVEVASGKVAWADFDRKADHYIAWPFWTADSKSLTVQWMNREQDTIRFYACDPETGSKTPVFEERQSSWVSFFEDLHQFRDGSGFLLRSDADGWSHLYRYDRGGRLRNRLTSGEWSVASINLVDESGGYVYFSGKPGKSWDTQIMRVRLDGSAAPEVLSKGPGSHRAHVSPGGKYFIDSVSTIADPGALTLYSTDGRIARRLGEARTPAMEQYAWGRAELFTIPSGDGFDLPSYWVLPHGFDPGRRYPVILNVYGGPDAGTVRNGWLGLQPHYWAQHGVITVAVDHRGSGHFGKRGAALMHRSLGKWEMADLIAAARWLRTKTFVDGARIGITGSSYGGYTTLMALTFGAEHFNFGLAGSSVSDWRLYDSVYTERYMDTPAENPQGYKNGAVLTWASRYKGGLRITHGTTDDNVHMQNSLQVVDWLTSHEQTFELMLYPGSRHGIQTAQRAHQMRESHDFWLHNLLSSSASPGGSY